MSWRDQLQKTKVGGVECFSRSGGLAFGRRTQVHEYPLRDKPFVEDLGRRAREFTLDLYVLGDDYMAARDRLIEVLEKPGALTLTHHWMGTMQVTAVDSRLDESTREGGIAHFRVTFVEAGENKFPTSASNTRKLVDDAANGAIDAEVGVFAEDFGIDQVTGFIRDAGALIANASLDNLLNFARRYGVVPEALSTVIRTAGSIQADVANVLTLPDQFARSWSGLVRDIAGVVHIDSIFSTGAAQRTVQSSRGPDSPLAVNRELIRSAQADLAAAFQGIAAGADGYAQVSQTTANRKIQAKNQDALLGLVRRTALVEETRATASRDFDSFTEAAAIRDDLADRLDLEAENAADDKIYQALTDLRAAVIRDVTTRAANLARVVQYTPKATLPALVVAHGLYGDAARAGDLIARNRSIRHPGFVTGGRAIEVLTDV